MTFDDYNTPKDEKNEDAIVQSDPNVARFVKEPEFSAAMSSLEAAILMLGAIGLEQGIVCCGTSRLHLNDPFSDMMKQVEQIPEDGMVLFILKCPDGPPPMEVVRHLSEKLRERNPNGLILTIPEDWSFRTMTGDDARSFMRNISSFLSKEELEKINLQRINEDDI